MSYNTWKMCQGIFGMYFSSDVGYLPYFHLVLLFQHITEMPSAQNLSVYVYIELFARTLKLLNHRIFIMECYQIYKAYVQQRKGACPFCHKANIKIHYPQLFCSNLSILHFPLDVQVLVLIAWCRYICIKKKTHHHRLLCKQRSFISIDVP